MAYTKFFAKLPCARCGRTTRATILSRLDDEGESFEVGDRVADHITIKDFDVSCFTVARPADSAPIHAVMSFTCASCNASNFAEVVIAEGRLRSIEAVDLDLETLARIHYLGGDDTEMLEAVAGQPLLVGGELVPNWLALVRAGIAAGRRW